MANVNGWIFKPSSFIRRCVVASLVVLFLSQTTWTVCYADNAEVLPKGVFGFTAEGKFYLPITKRFDENGDEESAAADLNADLDSSLFPNLALLEQAFRLPTGSASIGRSFVSFEYNYIVSEFTLQYGITDRLSAGIMIPYWDMHNDVQARLNTSRATVGKNAALNNLVPLFVPGTVRLTKNDVQNLIGKGLDINGDGKIDVKGFGFKPVESLHDSGLSDIEAGLRYQYLKTDDWRLAFTGGFRASTGAEDDPDSLVDRPFGTGAWALLFRLNNDYVGIRNLLLNLTLKYDLYLPDEPTLRIPAAVNEPITANKATVDRTYGDVLGLEASGTYQFYEGWSLTLLYKCGFSFSDEVTDKNDFHIQSLEDETSASEHVGTVALSYSTLPLYLAKKFPVPLTATLSYRNRFAGSDNVLKSEYIGFALSFYF